MATNAIGAYQAQYTPPPVQSVQKSDSDADSDNSKVAEAEAAEMAKAYMPNPTDTKGNNVNTQA